MEGGCHTAYTDNHHNSNLKLTGLLLLQKHQSSK